VQVWTTCPQNTKKDVNFAPSFLMVGQFGSARAFPAAL
jgi:hypothetical protein